MHIWRLWRRKTNGEALNEDRQKRLQEEQKLEEVKGQWEDVHRISEALRLHRESNHFAERIVKAVRGM
jgi:hypothetical protein